MSAGRLDIDDRCILDLIREKRFRYYIITALELLQMITTVYTNAVLLICETQKRGR